MLMIQDALRREKVDRAHQVQIHWARVELIVFRQHAYEETQRRISIAEHFSGQYQ
jgi:hypothetical protein